MTFIRGALCQVSDYTPVVTIPKTTAASLNGGISSQANFTIGLSCELDAESGTTSNTSSSLTATRPIAIGLLANSANAVSQAELLGLKTTGGGLTYLLSNYYGNAGVAEGVGIKIYDDSGTAMNFLPSPTTGTGNSGGWYGFKEVTPLESTDTSLETYRGHFTASLEKISGETATRGQFMHKLKLSLLFNSFICLFFFMVLNLWISTANAAVDIDRTRIVMNEGHTEAGFMLANTGKENVLLQIWTDTGELTVSPSEVETPLFVVPPIFKMAPEEVRGRVCYLIEKICSSMTAKICCG